MGIKLDCPKQSRNMVISITVLRPTQPKPFEEAVFTMPERVDPFMQPGLSQFQENKSTLRISGLDRELLLQDFPLVKTSSRVNVNS